MPIEAYLMFSGRCEEAVNFYQQALGAELEFLMHYRDSPEPPPPDMMPPGTEDKVMHASLRLGNIRLMACDDCTQRSKGFSGFQLSLTATNISEAERWFSALADGGEVRMPLQKTFFAQTFGMLTDRFGVPWMLIVPEPMPSD